MGRVRISRRILSSILLLKKHWGKGYGAEVAIGILEYGFAAMKLDRIDGGCDSGNIGSKCIIPLS